jgi:glutamate racemase
VIDPAPAVARQTARLLDTAGLRNTSSTPGVMRFFTSGAAAGFKAQLPGLLGESGEVQQINWKENRISYFGASSSPSIP